ncbi:MAG: DUF87 domain-containing protein [Selenomonadaceae bacterium]|nr:DUF87 domain-containing protein [Selenomonadaceae bacterium]
MQNLDKAIEQGRNLLQQLSKSADENFFCSEREWLGVERKMALNECCFFQIQELTFEEKAPRREAMENILGTFRGLEGVSFIYLILGNGQDIKFYFGVAKDFSHDKVENLSAPTVGGDLLKPGIQGNFRGCQIKELSNLDKKEILNRLQNISYAGILTGVPGTEKNNENFQGVDRLINVMAEDEFGFMVIASPATSAEISKIENSLIEIVDLLSPVVRHSLQITKSSGTNENETSSKNSGTQESESTQESKNSSESKTESTSVNYQKSNSNQQQTNAGQSSGNQYSINKSFSRTQSDSTNTSTQKDNSYSQKKSEDKRESNDTNGSSSNSLNYSVQNQTSYGFNYQISNSDSSSKSVQKTETGSEGVTKNFSSMVSESTANSTSKIFSENISQVEQTEIETKSAAHWIKYIEEILLPRLDCGRGKGIFLSCACLFANQPAILRRLANTAISLYSGPKGNRKPLAFHEFTESESACLHALQNMQIPAALEPEEKIFSAALSGWNFNRRACLGNWISVQELSIIAALPQKEVPGLALREEVEFGLNVAPVEEENKIPLGYLVQDGTERKIPVSLDRRALDKHTFVTGVTGSGKTTTCQNILINSGLPFLVIEPAKTEYRILKTRCPELIFFTPGKQDIAPFFLNPFELFPQEAITSRADMIKATLEASFAMEAAIPQIMETAVYRAYQNKGWDIRTNEWRPNDEPRNPFERDAYAFPTMSEFCEAVEQVTKEKNFGDRLQNEYMGSLKARIESLLVGAKGMMLDTPRSINFSDLIGRKVVIELEEIKNGAEKSLLMGFILTNLMQAIQARHRENPNFQHITLIEEAHRLLSRYVPGDSMNKKQGVEVFADMLAEVRKYGESLIIADQIPDKMTPEVLKNTNTKIVHKIFARDDKDAIGDTMALSDDQKKFLSKLPTGRAIIFSQGQAKAMQVKITKEADTTGQKEIDVSEIREIAEKYYSEPEIVSSGVLRGTQHLTQISQDTIRQYLWIIRGGYSLKKKYLDLFTNEIDEKAIENFLREIKQLENKVNREIWEVWIFCDVYKNYDEGAFQYFKNFIEKILVADSDSAISTVQRAAMGTLNVGGGS